LGVRGLRINESDSFVYTQKNRIKSIRM